MLAARVAARAQRAIRANAPVIKRNARLASDTAAKPAATGAVTGGLVGAGAALAVTYGWYHFSGARSVVQTAQSAKSYIDSATNSFKVQFQDKTPDTNEAIQMLRDTASKYASFVPGGKGYVDGAFNDLDSIRKKHGDEVDTIVREAYGELRDVSKKGLSLDTGTEAWNVLSKHLEKLASLAGDAAQDIMNNHPQLKQQLGGSVDQLKELGNRYGPEAKKQVDETWSEISDMLKQGISSDTASRIKKLVQDKSEQIRKMSEQAFNSGWEQVQPLLKDHPEVKKLVEDNMQTLKEGNVMEGLNQVRAAMSSGKTQDLDKYVQQAKQKGQQFLGGSLSSWLEMIPDGGQIMPQLMKLKDVAEKQGKEAEQLVKETLDEIRQVLEKKRGKIEELYKRSKGEVKDS